MKKIMLPLFALMCLVQWFVPGKMIYDSEHVIANGVLYKFKTQPVDPSDPFRGKYITLSFDANSLIIRDSVTWESGETIFVSFTTDSAGFAKAASVSREAPASEAYLQTTVTYMNTYGEREVIFNLPFDRFYLEESKASQAEQVYWQAQLDSTQHTYGLVSLGKGAAVLKDVMINDTSIVEIINQLNVDSE